MQSAISSSPCCHDCARATRPRGRSCCGRRRRRASRRADRRDRRPRAASSVPQPRVIMRASSVDAPACAASSTRWPPRHTARIATTGTDGSRRTSSAMPFGSTTRFSTGVGGARRVARARVRTRFSALRARTLRRARCRARAFGRIAATVAFSGAQVAMHRRGDVVAAHRADPIEVDVREPRIAGDASRSSRACARGPARSRAGGRARPRPRSAPCRARRRSARRRARAPDRRARRRVFCASRGRAVADSTNRPGSRSAWTCAYAPVDELVAIAQRGAAAAPTRSRRAGSRRRRARRHRDGARRARESRPRGTPR